MRTISLFLIIFTLFNLSACTSNPAEISFPVANNSDTAIVENFFPVTNFIRGEILTVKNSGITPRMFVTKNGKKDTSWLKIELLDSAFSPFLSPKIDTANLKDIFTETSFFDQTLNLYTFTYSRKSNASQFTELQRWNVYLNTGDSKVSSVYMEKSPGPGVKQLLTWQTGKSCKIITIKDDQVTEEKLIKWNYDENE